VSIQEGRTVGQPVTSIVPLHVTIFFFLILHALTSYIYVSLLM